MMEQLLSRIDACIARGDTISQDNASDMYETIKAIIAINPLVPVPDGAPCDLNWYIKVYAEDNETLFVLYENTLCCIRNRTPFNAMTNERMKRPPHDHHVIVQPIRLMPLKEVCNG